MENKLKYIIGALAIVCLLLALFTPIKFWICLLIFSVIIDILIAKYDYLNKPEFLFKIIIFFQVFLFFYITTVDSIPIDYGQIYTCVFKSKSGNHGAERLNYSYYDNDSKWHYISIRANYDKYRKKYEPHTSKAIIYISNDAGFIIEDNPSELDLEKYKYPVKTINKNYELGNDSYEYARYERDIAYKNYGFNIVQIAYPTTPNILYVTKLTGDKYYIKKDNNETDLYLAYSNINPDFYDGWHICPDSLCTTENIAKVDSAGYGYLFRGKIYSAAETEKYWDIIEQYKLRNH